MEATEAAKLWRLQQIDLRHRRLQQQLEQPKSKPAFDEAEAAAKLALTKLKKAENHLVELRKQVRSGELALASIDGEIKDAETTLYSGAITSGRELSNMEQRLSLAREKKRNQEEALLGAMQDMETWQEQATKLRQQAVEATNKYKTAQASLAEELRHLRQEMEQVMAQRLEAAAVVQPAWLGIYDKTRQQRPDLVAPIEGASCGACHVEVPPSVASQAGVGIKPTYCESCGRLLCVL